MKKKELMKKLKEMTLDLDQQDYKYDF